MKKSRFCAGHSIPGILLLLAGLCFSVSTHAQEPLTGTRLKSAGAANPRTVIRLQQPDEVTAIERLLERGDTRKALQRALGFVRQADQSGMDANSRYFAHNTLCVVYTKVGEYDKAISACDVAIETMPGHWSAWNNRGTLNLLTGNYAGARQDYQQALKQSPNTENVMDMLRHNLGLVDLYLSSPPGEDP